MAAKERNFTFMRMISHPERPDFTGDVNDIDLTTNQIQDLVEYQFSSQNPRYLTTGSFFVAGLTDSRATSERIYKTLLKAFIISAPSLDRSNDPVNTSAIGKNYRSQVSFISKYAQRKLVAMLFFWEEECKRWEMLDQEKACIFNETEQNTGDNQGSDVELRVLEKERRLLPSQMRV